MEESAIHFSQIYQYYTTIQALQFYPHDSRPEGGVQVSGAVFRVT